MSSGKWIRDPNTGHHKGLLDRVDEGLLGRDGWLDPERLFPGLRFDLTDVSSIAHVVGMGHRYFVNSVLTVPDCPIHVFRRRMHDQDTGAYLFTVYATMVTSAQAGGEIWRERRRFKRESEYHSLTLGSTGANRL